MKIRGKGHHSPLPTPHYPPTRLLLELLHIISGQFLPRALSPTNRVDWPLFQELVRRHRLSALFHRELPDDTPLPSPVRDKWEEEYHRQLARTVLEQDCLSRILEAFTRSGIKSIVLKGPHLAQEYYPHPALRPSDDIDLLIQPEDQIPAGKIIRKMGFSIVEESATAEKFSQADTGIFLEVHTGLQTPDRRNPSFEIKIEDFWRSSLPAQIADQPTRVLSPTINLLYLAAHLSHHGFSRIIWFYDLYLVIKKSGDSLNWDELIEKTHRYRCVGQVYYSLLHTGYFFGKTAPNEVLKELAPGPIKRQTTLFFITPGAILNRQIADSGWKALRNRFLINDDWILAFKKYFSSRG
ncbi:MAG: nucleotidyltransferase family protein [Candidatus Auribacterota bacterium]|nr:nucleotidyltransferase family protein [Candidatus Auribacterota bacterium]